MNIKEKTIIIDEKDEHLLSENGIGYVAVKENIDKLKDKLDRIERVLRIHYEIMPIGVYRNVIDIIKEGKKWYGRNK